LRVWGLNLTLAVPGPLIDLIFEHFREAAKQIDRLKKKQQFDFKMMNGLIWDIVELFSMHASFFMLCRLALVSLQTVKNYFLVKFVIFLVNYNHLCYCDDF
jgi:hypothetical protein